jgi:hypothetical protein
MMWSPALQVKGFAILCDVGVGHVHIAERDPNVPLDSEHPFATDVRSTTH